ncbi:hypothetical protein HYX70_02135 [Candidatus Saccharibacteria bacterium]|nr:hypothetical protein [Candidatus Saccharibacteria bacterium]
MSKNSHQKHELKKKHSSTNHTKQTADVDYKAHSFADIIIVLLIIGLGIIFILPFYAFMPLAAQMVLLILFGTTIVLFAASLWRQKPANMVVTHPQTAGHLAYLAAVVVLATVIILQILNGQLDIWLIVVLVIIMVVRSLLVISHKE